MKAVVHTGGKSYVISEGQTIRVEKLDLKEGEKLELPSSMTFDENGSTSFGSIKVAATIVSHGKADKVLGMKKRPRSTYRRKYGHRQRFTVLKISSISQ